MKTIYRFVLAAIIALVGVPAWSGTFGGEKSVNSDGTLVAMFPEVAFYNGVVHVVFIGFQGSNQGNVYYSRSVNQGPFSTPVNISANASPSYGHERAHVTAGPNGVYVAWSSNGMGAVYAKRSTDGGLNFGAQMLLGGVEGGYYSRLTHIFTDSGGRVHLTWYDSGDAGSENVGMIHHRSTCNGQDWGPNTQVTSYGVHGIVDNEQPRLGEAGGRMYLAFRSTRAGNPQGGWAPSSLWMHSGPVNLGTCTVDWNYPARRLAGGWPLSYGTTFRPELFGEPGGMLHVTYWENSAGANVYYRRGNVASASLGVPVKISNFGVDHLEPGGLASTTSQADGGFQVPPSIVSNGTQAFMAYQRVTGKTGQNFEMGPVYLRESSDNGANWQPEQQFALTGEASTPRLAIDNGNPNNVAVVWTDFRTGIANVRYRLYTLGAVVGGPSFQLSPDTGLAFGDRQVGSSQTMLVTVTNSGTAGNINGAALTGSSPSAADFAITGQTCGGSLGAGANCTYTVRFIPGAFGDRTATFTLSTNAADSPTSITLTGKGVNGATSAANVSAIVTGYYESILGRAPDAGGVPFWSGEANRVVALGADVREVFYALAIQFFNSAEYAARNRTDDQYIDDLYRTFFIRAADPGGHAYWKDYLNQGMDRKSLLGNFLFSPEFAAFMSARFGNPTIRAEINMTMDLYRGVFGRLPDNDGFNYWLGRVRAAQCQGRAAVTQEINTIAELFFTLPEYSIIESGRPAQFRTRMHVGDVYNAILRRGPEPAGFAYWVNELDTGARSRANVRSTFIGLGEFQARVDAVVAEPCIPQ